MKTLILVGGLSVLLAAGAAARAATPEDTLFHWGECAAAGGLYQAAIQMGTKNATLSASFDRFQVLAPRMEKLVDPLADSLGEEKSAAVTQRLEDSFKPVLQTWNGQGDFGDFAVKQFGPVMDRCLREAEALPEA